MTSPPRTPRRVVSAPAKRQRVELLSIRAVVESDPDPDISYLEQDEFEDRLKAYQDGEFQFVGVVVEAEVEIESTVQYLRSPGLWGIESDSDKDYILSVCSDEYEELRKVLKTVGVPTDRLPKAFEGQVEWRV